MVVRMVVTMGMGMLMLMVVVVVMFIMMFVIMMMPVHFRRFFLPFHRHLYMSPQNAAFAEPLPLIAHPRNTQRIQAIHKCLRIRMQF